MQNRNYQLTQERDTLQNNVNQLTRDLNNEQGECYRWRGIAQKIENGMQTCIDALLLDKFALNLNFGGAEDMV